MTKSAAMSDLNQGLDCPADCSESGHEVACIICRDEFRNAKHVRSTQGELYRLIARWIVMEREEVQIDRSEAAHYLKD